MDNRSNQTLNDLFSRAATPPANNVALFQSQFGVQNSSASIDSLFQTMASATDHDLPQGPSMAHNIDPYAVHSSADSPINLIDEPPSMMGPNVTATERQNALLSLLSSGPSNPSANTSPSNQVPTPPAANRSQASPPNSEAQGKILLETLMGG
jgi:hypothetical protein